MAKLVTIGEPAPDVEYVAPDGSRRRLAQLWTDSAVLAVWLRHCG